MGFFGKIFEAMGFQSNQVSTKNVNKKEKNISTKASFKLKKRQKVEKVDNIDGIKVFYPEQLEMSKEIYEEFKKGEPVVIGFEYTEAIEVDKIKAYFSGICDASESTFVSINGEKMYILLPKGVELEN